MHKFFIKIVDKKVIIYLVMNMMITLDQIESTIISDNVLGKIAVPASCRDGLIASTRLRRLGRVFVPSLESDGVLIGYVCFLN